ncbi:hypothetical protein GCK72_008594 [Caenorhabditis remanei]|uniref:Uncharacterized protein n=1 Tax=Caenorhabditis remanei TaxID=31234 RepID=A0A6A5H0F5_CAERE|nr:hypothetical protein GCK72_008594 [Caenorhabditis remanei]KAF1760345.1 hypothetical protein GCK72_008594 [Caenorhabditis remanei]
MLDTPLEGIFTCAQFTGLGVFYTYFLALILSFNIPITHAVYMTFLGALLVHFSGFYKMDNWKYEPKTCIVYGLYMMSFCSAALAACFFAQGDVDNELILIVLPKVSCIIFFISFYLTRISSVFYVNILCAPCKSSEVAGKLTWLVAVILMAFNLVGYEDYQKSLGITLIVYGFLYLSLAFFISDKLPETRGLFDHEVAKLFGFYQLQHVLKYEEHRTLSCSDGTTFYFRNLTNDKVAINLIFSNPNDHLTAEHFSRKNIRGRGHLKIEVKRREHKQKNDRLFIFYAKDLKDLENMNKCGFLTVRF